MGRKRKGKSKVTTRKKQRQAKTLGSDMLGGILVVIALMYAVFLSFENIGTVAEVIKSLSKGLFGNAVYMIPITMAIVGIHAIVSEKKINMRGELLKGLYLTILASAVLFTFAGEQFAFSNDNANVVSYFVSAYKGEMVGASMAGLFGTLIASIFVKIIGVLGSRILLVGITSISLLCILNISFEELFHAIAVGFWWIVDEISKVTEILFRKSEETTNLREERKARRQELEAQRQEKRKQDKMQEPGVQNPEKNLKLDKTEQIEFDFNKLGGKPSEDEIQAKQQRDEFFKKQKEQKEDKSVKEVLTLDHTSLVEEDHYEFPPIELLMEPKNEQVFDKKAIHGTAVKLQKTLASFGVEAKVTNITKGPTVTRYELTPSTGVKVSKIVNLADDIALNLAAKSIRIEAPIPGKAAVGIEVPNSVSESVYLREVISSKTFEDHKSKLAFSLGKDASGEIVVGDIAKMPHVLIAGATGSGKSVCINSLIVSILYKSKPSEVKLILVDPKMVELSGYNGIPHLLIPVVTDPKKAAGALNWAVQEMVNRYSLFASKGVKDIKGYNNIMGEEQGARLPQIVIIIDELADLMMVAPNDVEDAICRLAQMARAAGMHLVIATQRPSVDVITGIIKANVPSRIAFTVSSQVDSRTILDMAGAEKLLGKGDMLYFPVGETKPLRIQGAFISEKEIEEIVQEIKSHVEVDTTYSDEIIKSIESANKGNKVEDGQEEEGDALLNDAIDLVVDMGQASASMLQRRFKIGYSRAGRIVDQMEARGLISGYDGSKPRQVLVSKDEWQELKMGGSNTANEDLQDEGNTSSTLQPNLVTMDKPHSHIDVEL